MTKPRSVAATANDNSIPGSRLENGGIGNIKIASDASISSSKLSFLQSGTDAVSRSVESTLRDSVSVKDFGAVGNGSFDDTQAIQAAVNYCITNLRNLYFPAGTYLISSTIKFIDNEYAEDYPFPRLDQIILTGESGSKIKAASGFVGAMVFMGDVETSTGFKGALFLNGLTLDGSNQEIKLVDALPNWQARFYAEDSNFLGVTGPNSYAIDSTYSSVWLRNCVLQASGNHPTNGTGLVARYTSIVLDNCFISYFGRAIYFTNFAESSVQVRNSLFQINKVNLEYQGGGYLNNTSSFIGCYFVESKPDDIHFKVSNQASFGSWGNISFVSCQFDGYNAVPSTPLLDLDFGNCGANFTFEGCNAWVSTNPPGTVPLTNVIIGQYTSAWFNNCTNINILSDNNPPYAKFLETQNSGTAAGPSIAGDNTRIINTTVVNKISGCSLSSNQITLQPGVYKISASAPCFKGDAHALRLFNVTLSGVVIRGTNSYASSIFDGLSHSVISGRLIVSSPTTYRLSHFITTSEASSGLGVSVSDGGQEIYSQIEIWKEA